MDPFVSAGVIVGTASGFYTGSIQTGLIAGTTTTCLLFAVSVALFVWITLNRTR
jgi:hypothetical protein